MGFLYDVYFYLYEYLFLSFGLGDRTIFGNRFFLEKRIYKKCSNPKSGMKRLNMYIPYKEKLRKIEKGV